MEDLIKALLIFSKYGNPRYPTNCSHDELFVAIEPEAVSEEDKKLLEDLGFIPCKETDEGFISFRFGSR